MNNSQEILTSILQTTQMGQVGIRSVMDAATQTALRSALESQLREYDAIETEAYAIASQRGWDLEELDSGKRVMADMMSRMKLGFHCTDSKIAGMMIEGNTKGVIKSLRDKHRFHNMEGPVATLSQKLLDCETANIQQMHPFL